MNKYGLICEYCDYSWQINYKPDSFLYCLKCSDKNIRIFSLASSKIDYYSGSPEFIEEEQENWNF